MRFIKWLFQDAFNISVVTRLWTVDCDDWYGGTFKCFWLKHNAMKYAKKQTALFVKVKNEITGKSVSIRNNPDKECPPTIIKGGSHVS